MYLDIHTYIYIYIHNKHRLIIALNNFVFKYAWLFHSTYIYTYTHLYDQHVDGRLYVYCKSWCVVPNNNHKLKH